MSRGVNGSNLNGVLWENITLKLNGSTNIPFTNGLCVELDILECVGTSRIIFNDGNNHQQVWNSDDIWDDIGHWKFTFKDNVLTKQLNNNPTSTDSFDTSINTFKVQLQCYYNFEVVKFANFQIYKI